MPLAPEEFYLNSLKHYPSSLRRIQSTRAESNTILEESRKLIEEKYLRSNEAPFEVTCSLTLARPTSRADFLRCSGPSLISVSVGSVQFFEKPARYFNTCVASRPENQRFSLLVALCIQGGRSERPLELVTYWL
jgi:hypothetical protein